ncbi:MAG: response regulator [Burkholderiales bacterium]|nr:response regulator [Burkholderiales bacterium]
MARSQPKPIETRAPRRRGVERPRARARPAANSRDTERLLHELHTHQIELEMQNEALLSARTELEAALARYTELYDFAPIGYLVLGAEGNIRELNFSAASLLGVTRGALANERLDRFMPKAERAAFIDFLATVLQTRKDRAYQRDVSIDTTRGLVDVHVTAVLRPTSEPTLLLAIQDITARKQAEAMALEANRRKDEFLAVLAHELRNPLMPIKMNLAIADRLQVTDERLRKVFEVIERQASHLTRIVDDLLDVARVARGKIVLRVRPVDLGDIVRQVTEDYRSAADAAGIALISRIESEPLWVEADRTRMTQVIGNLLGNALKFTPRSGWIEVALRGADNHAELRIRDNGIGMAAEVLRHAGEAFAQAPQSGDRPRGGLGLGLAMSKGLVELHHGSLAVASEGLGRGATVVVRLPLRTAPSMAASDARDAALGHHRILIIEDNLDAAESLRLLLELSGQHARVVHDGVGGVSAAKAFRPHIILCDIGLPGMDGYAVARALRADSAMKDVYLVALSGYALPQDVQRASEAGFDRHIAKPISEHQLENLLLSVPAAPHGGAH